jgi:hypothetical protein
MIARNGRAVAFAFAALLSFGGCSGGFGDRVRQQVQRSIAVGRVPLVRVDNVAGTVRVEGWSRPIVDVDATKYGNDASELRDITIAVNRQSDGVSVVTSYGGAIHGGGVRYRISVPTGASVRIRNVAGTVDLAGVGGDVDVETQAGAITANLGRVTGDRSIDLRATTGAVTLSISSASDARVTAYSTIGAFANDVPGITQQRENVVGVRGGGTIGSGSARITLTTTTGAIALQQQ